MIRIILRNLFVVLLLLFIYSGIFISVQHIAFAKDIHDSDDSGTMMIRTMTTIQKG